MIDKSKIEELLCHTFCADIHLQGVRGRSDVYFVKTPFSFSDGDTMSLYLKEIPFGYRITDLAHTFMHLSYENDTEALKQGTRGRLLEQIFAEFDISENEGELYIEIQPERLSEGLFRMGQALTRITDLTFLNRATHESTFYEDLYRAIVSIVPADLIYKDYIVPNIPNSSIYPVDYRIQGVDRDLFLFGVPNREKARLTTISLQQFVMNEIRHESLIIFEDQSTMNRGDLARLTNVSGEMISSLDAKEDMKRKLKRKGDSLDFRVLVN